MQWPQALLYLGKPCNYYIAECLAAIHHYYCIGGATARALRSKDIAGLDRIEILVLAYLDLGL